MAENVVRKSYVTTVILEKKILTKFR